MDEEGIFGNIIMGEVMPFGLSRLFVLDFVYPCL